MPTLIRFLCFFQPLLKDARLIRLQPLPSRYLPVHYSLILSFDAVLYDLLRGSLNDKQTRTLAYFYLLTENVSSFNCLNLKIISYLEVIVKNLLFLKVVYSIS
jgi:hypothetical protein